MNFGFEFQYTWVAKGVQKLKVRILVLRVYLRGGLRKRLRIWGLHLCICLDAGVRSTLWFTYFASSALLLVVVHWN